ncbi:MAG: hypothetical protein KatS3mg057_0219 [Herpetosiphonaceae bacterium]|nr:MAG: hypothetical protein KatS3mg057_0219 [Herpetosiphonaceae bacterium]
MDYTFWEIDEGFVTSLPPGLFYEIVMDVFFNARHYVVVGGRTGPIHSHSYRLQVACRSWSLTEQEHIIVGYAPLRERLEQVVEAYNNHLLNELPPFRRLQPTTENLAAVLFQQLSHVLKDLPIKLISVTVWESPTISITIGYQEAMEHFDGHVSALTPNGR